MTFPFYVFTLFPHAMIVLIHSLTCYPPRMANATPPPSSLAVLIILLTCAENHLHYVLHMGVDYLHMPSKLMCLISVLSGTLEFNRAPYPCRKPPSLDVLHVGVD